jgi:signal transduction histidine kinase
MTSEQAQGVPDTITSNALRLRQLIRYNRPAAPIAIPLILLLYWKYHSAVLLVMVVALVLTVIAQRVAISYARQDRIAEGITWFAIAIWCQTLTTGIFTPRLWPLTCVFSILAVVIALPFVTGRQLLGLIVGASGILIISAVFASLNPLLSLNPVPDWLLRLLVPLGALSGAVLCMLSIWQSGGRMQDTIEETRAANEALRESERSLERKVEARTAQLESSYLELAAARDEAVQASRAKSDFLANMSHELRTPLNAIIGYSEMLEEEAGERGDDYLLDINRVVSSGRYLLSLVNGILDLSRIEAGKMGVFIETFDLEELVRGVESTVAPLARKNVNTLTITMAPSLGVMQSDATKVRQVLFNLLGNACKFTHHGGVSLDVAGEVGDDGVEWVHLRVSDTGIGMSPEQTAEIFDAFHQAEERTLRDFGGTGLGLTITRQFCEILGGSISVESEPGIGSTFLARLPRRSSAGLLNPADTYSVTAVSAT